jgi:hypothetical protein
MAFDAPASAHAGLVLARFMRGDVRGADEQTEAARDRCDTLEFPMGPFTAAYAQFFAWWASTERGDLASAATAVTAVADIAARHSFDFWALMAANLQAMIDGLAALDTRCDDTETLAVHAEAVEGLCAMWQMLDLRLFLPFATAIAGHLRAGAGDATGAAARYKEALDVANAKGLHFYDAEVMRLQSQLLPEPEAKSRLRVAFDLARTQGAVPFELRIALDLLARGDTDAFAFLAAAVARFPADAHYPELDDARALLAAAG